MKQVNKVYTAEYRELSKFKLNPFNRNLDEKHVKRLAKELRAHGWQGAPIVVNKNFVVIDGNHRLAAAKAAMCYIKYTVDENEYTMKDIQRLNSTAKKWTQLNRIESLANSGSEPHRKYLQLHNKYVVGKKMKPTTIVACLTGNLGVRSTQFIESEDFEFTLEDYEKVDKILGDVAYCLEPLVITYKKSGTMNFEKAVLFLLQNGADKERLHDKILKHFDKNLKYADIESAITELTNIYNTRVPANQRMYFADKYREWKQNRYLSKERADVRGDS